MPLSSPASGLAFTALSGAATYNFAQGGTQVVNFTLTDPVLTGVKLALLSLNIAGSGSAGAGTNNPTDIYLVDASYLGIAQPLAFAPQATDAAGFSSFASGFSVVLVPVFASVVKMRITDGIGGPHNGNVTINIIGTFQ